MRTDEMFFFFKKILAVDQKRLQKIIETAATVFFVFLFCVEKGVKKIQMIHNVFFITKKVYMCFVFVFFILTECLAYLFQNSLVRLRNAIVLLHSWNKRFWRPHRRMLKTDVVARASRVIKAGAEAWTNDFLFLETAAWRRYAWAPSLPCPLVRSCSSSSPPSLIRLLSHTPTHTSLGLPVAHLHITGQSAFGVGVSKAAKQVKKGGAYNPVRFPFIGTSGDCFGFFTL